jgi:hypothetical protein
MSLPQSTTQLCYANTYLSINTGDSYGITAVRGGVLFSPGDLSAQSNGVTTLGNVSSHAALKGDCAACHTSPWETETMQDRCLSCHINVKDEFLETESLHNVLLTQNAYLTCKDCHPDHRGENASLTLLDLNHFPHEAVGFSLRAHQTTTAGSRFSCSDCHGDDITKFEIVTCDKCHQGIDFVFSQAHKETFGTECLACHDGIDLYGGEFDHNVFIFPLEGEHAELLCSKCHLGDHSIQALQTTPQECFACHETDDEHSGEFGINCDTCHTPNGWEEALFDHALSNFPLDGEHANVECEECHVNGIYEGTPQECSACHEEPLYHAGLFDVNCASCHTNNAWIPAQYNESHTFPMNHESNGNNTCQTCHVQSLQTYTCYECHEHSPSNVASEHREEGISDFENCMECHPDGREHEGDDD